MNCPSTSSGRSRTASAEPSLSRRSPISPFTPAGRQQALHCRSPSASSMKPASDRGDKNMQGGVLYGPRDGRFEERGSPKIGQPTDAVVKAAARQRAGRIMAAGMTKEAAFEPIAEQLND